MFDDIYCQLLDLGLNVSTINYKYQ